MAGRYSARDRKRIRHMNPVSNRLRLDTYLDQMLGFPTTGEIFYVDPSSGSDENGGSASDDAFATLQKGIDACANNNGDVIVRMRGGEAVTSVVDFNKSGITVIPQSYGGPMAQTGEYFSTYSTTLTADPTAIVTADCVTIVGMAFVGVDAGALFYDGAALLLRASLSDTATAAPYGTRILNCRFPKWNLANRIGIAIDGASNSVIEGCEFEGVGADFDSGIYVQGATQNLEISDNRFRDCTYGVLYGSFTSGPHAIIKSNVFEDSKLVSVSAAAPTHICDNWSELAVGTASFNVNYAALAALGVYCSDNHYAEVD